MLRKLWLASIRESKLKMKLRAKLFMKRKELQKEKLQLQLIRFLEMLRMLLLMPLVLGIMDRLCLKVLVLSVQIFFFLGELVLWLREELKLLSSLLLGSIKVQPTQLKKLLKPLPYLVKSLRILLGCLLLVFKKVVVSTLKILLKLLILQLQILKRILLSLEEEPVLNTFVKMTQSSTEELLNLLKKVKILAWLKKRHELELLEILLLRWQDNLLLKLELQLPVSLG